MTIIKCGENPAKYSREEIGGKGLNLLGLYNHVCRGRWFNVPEFFIIPTQSIKSHGLYDVNFKDNVLVEKAFNELKKPVIVRSSSPLEDGINASFAGQFRSIPGKDSFDGLRRAVHDIDEHATIRHGPRDYADHMGIEYNYDMAFIIQTENIDFRYKGVIQINEPDAIIEYFDRKKNKFCAIEMDVHGLEDVPGCTPSPEADLGNDIWGMLYAAKDVQDSMGMKGMVQIEFCRTPGKPIDFVQIRQLPEKSSHLKDLDLTIPEGVPYLESKVCNDIGCDLTLPAYVTFSQAGFRGILISAGWSGSDGRFIKFTEKSNLCKNADWPTFLEYGVRIHSADDEEFIRAAESRWELGNRLFDNYVLVCDKLDDKCAGMSQLTTNKKAIMTFFEAMKTSHAMTVARDLGIPAMGLVDNIKDLNSFMHQVETGDLIHMKSNGKKAIAWVEKKREGNPYEALEERMEED